MKMYDILSRKAIFTTCNIYNKRENVSICDANFMNSVDFYLRNFPSKLEKLTLAVRETGVSPHNWETIDGPQ